MANRLSRIAILILIPAAGCLAGFKAKVQIRPSGQLQIQEATPAPKQSDQNHCDRVNSLANHRHAYHAGPPTSQLPPILNPTKFADNKTAFVVYSIAAKIPTVLYQEPCYCPCDSIEGHQSLLDCFTSDHGSKCLRCQLELVFTYQQFEAGRTPAEIRKAMEAGGFYKVDLEKYVQAHYGEYKGKHP